MIMFCRATKAQNLRTDFVKNTHTQMLKHTWGENSHPYFLLLKFKQDMFDAKYYIDV